MDLKRYMEKFKNFKMKKKKKKLNKKFKDNH